MIHEIDDDEAAKTESSTKKDRKKKKRRSSGEKEQLMFALPPQVDMTFPNGKSTNETDEACSIDSNTKRKVELREIYNNYFIVLNKDSELNQYFCIRLGSSDY